MSITDKIYTDEPAARKHLEKLLWPHGPVCPHCSTTGEATALKGKSTRPGVYWCNSCQKPFSVTVGTVYERSHIPLNKWLLATHLITSSKKGISAHQLMRMLDLGSYRSAWFMAHRIRAAMTPAPGSESPLGGEGKVVEADEAYIGKKDGPKGRKSPGAGGAGHKRTVLSLVERGGRIRSFKLGGPNAAEIKAKIHTNVDPASTLHTDGSQVYKGYLRMADHESVDHKSEYVREGKANKVHTNTLEGFFSVFKRGMVGTYQHCGEQHLDRYLAEFDFRANYRVALGFDDADRAAIATKGIAGKRLTYRRTHAA
jgi:transposase-like protein